jgi:hypothetical protein
MAFGNEEEAKKCLAHISYFRLKYYWTDMRDEETEHDFKEGSLFDDVIARYNFDRNLRLILFDAIEIIEVALRAKIINHLSQAKDSGLWYLDASLFERKDYYEDFVLDLKYEFGLGWSTANNQWEATISETSTLAAHTPYIFKCSDTEATFIGTIASVPTDIEASLVEVGASEGDDKEWKFKGTYTALDWTSANPTEPTYGFSTYVPAQTIAAGTFVRFVQGASLAPFRARLIYSGSNTHLNARGHSRAAQAESELPRYIIVRIIGADGTATAIGTLDTTTGQLSTDGWYTLGGCRLEAKPNAKGIYIHNGRKVIVK